MLVGCSVGSGAGVEGADVVSVFSEVDDCSELEWEGVSFLEGHSQSIIVERNWWLARKGPGPR